MKLYQSQKRVLIVDFQHIAYQYLFSKASRLSVKVVENGKVVDKDMTIPAYSIKKLVSMSKGGEYPLVVCMDSKIVSRKEAIKFYNYKHIDKGWLKPSNKDDSYKAGRKGMAKDFYESLRITQVLLEDGGVTVLRAENYEADDLVFAAVQQAKRQFSGYAIDVITNDMDLLPLVDEQVSVYLRSPKMTVNDPHCPQYKKYVQFNHDNFESAIEVPSAFNKLKIPYNFVLLAKILRGDSADNLRGKVGWTPTKFNDLVDSLTNSYSKEQLELFARYGTPQVLYEDKMTGEIIKGGDLVSSVDLSKYVVKYGNPAELEYLLTVVKPFVSEDDLEFIVDRYTSMNLNGVFQGFSDVGLNRGSYLCPGIKTNFYPDLQKSVARLKINI